LKENILNNYIFWRQYKNQLLHKKEMYMHRDEGEKSVKNNF